MVDRLIEERVDLQVWISLAREAKNPDVKSIAAAETRLKTLEAEIARRQRRANA